MLDRSNATALLASIGVLLLLAPAVAPAQKTAGERIDDATIAATVKAGLLDHAATSAVRINVESDRATVQLSGFAETQAEKDAAGRVAADVAGVRRVINSIALAPRTSLGTKLDDSVVTGKVKAALIDAKDVKSLQINVETRAGVTQLAGFVDSAEMKARAGRIAADVAGVSRVDNVLVVRESD